MNNIFFTKAKKFILLKDIFNICNQPCKNAFNKKSSNDKEYNILNFTPKIVQMVNSLNNFKNKNNII
jgi:hypothetical protein